MQPSTSPSWMMSTNSNLVKNASDFRSNRGHRKRKVAECDFDERTNQKMFVTEDKMVKEMQTLSLELENSNNNNANILPQTSPIEIENSIDEVDSNDEKEPHLELHKLLTDSLKNDDLQDSLIRRLCDIERKKFTMQIVPYMPVHPAQLNNDNNIATEEKTKDGEEIMENSNSSDDYQFKMPSIPTPYTVEEPCDTVIKRGSTMKRSYSQSDPYNSSLSVTELKQDGKDFSPIQQSQSAYFIVEPTNLAQTTSNTSSSSLSSGGPSIRITEFIENSSSNNEFSSTLDDDDIDMQSVTSSDAGDKMDDD